MSNLFPAHGRVAGIDFGTVRIGVAISDDDRTIASPYENYTRRDEQRDAAFFQQLVNDEQIVGFVVGLPVHLSGQESKKSNQARHFGLWLGKTTGKPVVFFDERFTTSIANEILSEANLTKKKRQRRLDMLAAQIMLSAFMQASDPLDYQKGLDD